jgi:hypothetical protein
MPSDNQQIKAAGTVVRVRMNKVNHSGRPRLPTQDEAEAIAVHALGFLAADPQRMAAFFDVTGMSPGDLTASAGEHATLASILQALSQDESALLAFAADNGLDPATIEPARMVLAGEIPAARPRR